MVEGDVAEKVASPAIAPMREIGERWRCREGRQLAKSQKCREADERGPKSVAAVGEGDVAAWVASPATA